MGLSDGRAGRAGRAPRWLLGLAATALVACGRTDLGDPSLAAGVGSGGASGSARDAGSNGPCTADAGRPELAIFASWYPGPNRKLPVLWPPGCIDVEYDPAIASELPLLEAALAAWSAPSCTAMCFKTPRPQTESGPHQLMVSWNYGGMEPTDGAIAVYYSTNPSSTEFTMAWIFRRQGTPINAGDYFAAVGRVLNFAATPGVPSVENTPDVALSAADSQSVCALYPGCK